MLSHSSYRSVLCIGLTQSIAQTQKRNCGLAVLLTLDQSEFGLEAAVVLL